MLNKRVAMKTHRKRIRRALVLMAGIIIEMFGILITLQRIGPAAGIKMIGRILSRIDIVFEKSKMGAIPDLDKAHA